MNYYWVGPIEYEGSVSLAQDLGLELLGLPRGTSSYFAPEITVVRHFSQNGVFT